MKLSRFQLARPVARNVLLLSMCRAKGLSGLETIMEHQRNQEFCAHTGCNCTRREGSKYCSQYCEDAGTTLELACNCQHAGCGVEGTFKHEETGELVTEKA